MMATYNPTQPGMGPTHPAMSHGGHPMGMQHPGAGPMGHPNPAMMQAGMHPAMSGPQVTQATMTSGMPGNPGTPAPGNMPNNPMAMAHLGGSQGPMFQGAQGQQMMNQMQLQQQQNIMAQARQRAMLAQQNGMHPNMMNMNAMKQHFNQQQLSQMGINMMPGQAQMQGMTPQQQQAMHHQQQQYHHQQRVMAQHHMQQQAMAAQQQRAQQQQQLQQQQQQAQQQQAVQQQAAQMAITRSQETATQPPQPVPTPAPQTQPQPQPTPTPQNKPAPQATPQQQPQQPPTTQPNTAPSQPQNAPTPQVKQNDTDDETSIKPEMIKQQIIPNELEMKIGPAHYSGQSILQLLSYQDHLANPGEPNNYSYWEGIIAKYFSPTGSIRQQLFNTKTGYSKSFQLQFASLARFYFSHFKNGVKQILMWANEYSISPLDNGANQINSLKSSVTYVYHNDIRVTTFGSIKVTFNEAGLIELLSLETKDWSEAIPRSILPRPGTEGSPEQTRSPKMKKNQGPKSQPQLAQQMNLVAKIPGPPCGDFGLPDKLLQFLEIAEIATIMAPIMQTSSENHIGPREALNRINAENQNFQNKMMQANQGAAMANGQVQFPNQKMVGMNPPNAFQSPAFSHLNLPNAQGSPHMANHTPSPAHNAQGGVAMVHQMSAQGSNLSGSGGPSTNTSPNVSHKRRRPSAIKDEEAANEGSNKTKPSPRMQKRQKGANS